MTVLRQLFIKYQTSGGYLSYAYFYEYISSLSVKFLLKVFESVSHWKGPRPDIEILAVFIYCTLKNSVILWLTF